MKNILVQKSGAKTVTYTIEDSGLLIQSRIAGKFAETTFAFEHLRTHYITVIKHNPMLLVLGTISLISAGLSAESAEGPLTAIGIVLVLFFGFAYLATRIQVRRFATTEPTTLEFFTSARLEGELNAFLITLFRERNTYLISRWGRVSPHLEYAGQFENLNWLLTNRILSKTLYEEKLAELEALFDARAARLPFDFSSGEMGPEWN